MGKKEKMLVLSELEKVLLTLLYDRSLYGLEFINAVKTASDGNREIGLGSLYPTLTRMGKKGLLSWRWGDEQSGPRRKYYDITPFGASVLDADWKFHKKLRAVEVSVDSSVSDRAEVSVVETKAEQTLKK